MDFKLSVDQELIVQAYREYMESEPWDQYFQECDEKHEYPLRWVKGLCDLGFDQIMLPEDRGGLGLEQPLVTLMAVYEVLGQYGGPTYVLYQLPGFETIIREGTPEQIDARLARNALFKDRRATDLPVHLIDNSGDLADAVKQLLGLIRLNAAPDQT